MERRRRVDGLDRRKAAGREGCTQNSFRSPLRVTRTPSSPAVANAKLRFCATLRSVIASNPVNVVIVPSRLTLPEVASVKDSVTFVKLPVGRRSVSRAVPAEMNSIPV